MSLFLLFLIIAGICIILYLDTRKQNNIESFIDVSNINEVRSELQTYLSQAVQTNQKLKTLLSKYQQTGGGYNESEKHAVDQVSKENKGIIDKINTLNFAMAEAPIPYDMMTPMDQTYDNTGDLGNGNLKDILNNLASILDENNRILTNINKTINTGPTTTAAPGESPVTQCITKGMYWNNDTKTCYDYESSCKSMDLSGSNSSWPKALWDKSAKQCTYLSNFPKESTNRLMSDACTLLDGKWDPTSNVCFGPNLDAISRNSHNLDNIYINTCNKTPGYSYNAITNTCEKTQTPMSTTVTPALPVFVPLQPTGTVAPTAVGTAAPMVPTTSIPVTTAPTTVAPTTAPTSNDDKTRWLNIHNQLRSKHCAPNVVWNDQLAQLAGDWATKLANDNISFSAGNPIPHPSGTDQKGRYQTLRDSSGNPLNNGYNGQVGQNLAIGHPSVKTIENVTMDWYNEVNYPNLLMSNEYNLSDAEKQKVLQDRLNQKYQSEGLTAKCGSNPTLAYKYDKLPDCSPDTGHFTQLVWKDTTEIGCARVIRPDGYEVYACNYNKPGNVYGYDDQSTLANFTANVKNPANC